MIINGKSNSLVETKRQGDHVHFKHVQYTGDVQESVKKLKKGFNQGWTDSKENKHIARIPELLFAKIGYKIAPEGRIDEKALNLWLQTPEGAPYKVSNM